MRDDERRDDLDFHAVLEVAHKMDVVKRAWYRERRAELEAMVVAAQGKAPRDAMAIHSPGEPASMGAGDR